MYVFGVFGFGVFGFGILVGFIQVGFMFYNSFRKPLSYLKKKRYNMTTVYDLRRKIPNWVREDERHLYQKRLSKSICRIHNMIKTN